MKLSKAMSQLLATTVMTACFAAPSLAQTAPAEEPVFGDDAATTAQARQNDQTSDGAIVVTGSRIARPNLIANSPIAVVEREQLVANADVTLETFLNTLPQANPAGTTTSNNPGNAGQANINLRGLGATRNLVLVDGRRPMVSAAAMTVDLNTIPAALIERIDVITGGAGATYGADAVAGVVNVILRSNFQGLDARATYANTVDADAREFNASLLMGGNFLDGRGNAVIGFDYTDREGLIKSQRPFAAMATSTTTFLPEGWYNTGGNAPTQAAIDAVFGSYGFGAGSVPLGNVISFNTDGTLFSTGVFNSPFNVVNFRYPIDLSVNQTLYPDFYSYNFDEVNLLVLPLERRAVMGKLNFEVSSIFQPFTQFGWTRYNSTTALAPTPFPTVITSHTSGTNPAHTKSALVNPGSTVNSSMVIPVTNPFIPADLRVLLNSRTGNDPTLVGEGATEPFLMRHRTLGAGARTANYTNEVIQYLGGVRGDITPSWRYEAYYSEGRTEIVNRGEGAIDSQRVQNLLEAADGGNSICAGGYNPFGRNPISPECLRYIEVSTRSSMDFEQRIAQAFIAGDIAPIWGGNIGAVLGAEIRQFEYANDPGALSGPISGPNVVTPAAGENSFRDYFAELLFPLMAGQPWAQSLELSLGWRLSRYKSQNNITGVQATPSTDHTYKAELSYAPVNALRLRGTYQHAVRAPNFGELFAGGGSAPSYFDPCSINTQFRAGALGASAEQALLLCRGANSTRNNPATPNFLIDAAQFANYVQAPGSQLNIQLTGNPNVRPEQADTFTLGAVFNAITPSGPLSTLRGSLDYYHMRINDAIVTIDPNTILADCFDYFGTNPGLDPNRPTCRALNRQGSFMNTVSNPFGGGFQVNNDNRIRTSGIDMQLSWALPLEWVGAPNWGRLNFDLLLNHLLEFKVQEGIEFLGLPEVDYAGSVSYFGQGLGTSFPRWNGVLNTNYALGNSSVNWRARYIHSMVNRAALQYAGETIFTGVPSIWYHDLTFTTNVDNMMFRVGVNNLFNTQPPTYAPNVQSGTDPSLYDVIGRRFFVTAGVRF
jgi:iron complex outermembrane recepter protein